MYNIKQIICLNIGFISNRETDLIETPSRETRVASITEKNREFVSKSPRSLQHLGTEMFPQYTESMQRGKRERSMRARS